jgi:hypothetical protein
VFVCVGGGGMVAGVAAYIKALRPEVLVFGVEADDAAGMTESLVAGQVVTLPTVGLFADGAAVRTVGTETFRVSNATVDGMICVKTDEICAAIKMCFNDTRCVLEPAGALGIAGTGLGLELVRVRARVRAKIWVTIRVMLLRLECWCYCSIYFVVNSVVLVLITLVRPDQVQPAEPHRRQNHGGYHLWRQHGLRQVCTALHCTYTALTLRHTPPYTSPCCAVLSALYCLLFVAC